MNIRKILSTISKAELTGAERFGSPRVSICQLYFIVNEPCTVAPCSPIPQHVRHIFVQIWGPKGCDTIYICVWKTAVEREKVEVKRTRDTFSNCLLGEPGSKPTTIRPLHRQRRRWRKELVIRGRNFRMDHSFIRPMETGEDTYSLGILSKGGYNETKISGHQSEQDDLRISAWSLAICYLLLLRKNIGKEVFPTSSETF